MKAWLFLMNLVIAIFCAVPVLNRPLNTESDEDGKKRPFHVETIYFNLEEELLPILKYKIKLQWLIYFIKVTQSTKF